MSKEIKIFLADQSVHPLNWGCIGIMEKKMEIIIL